EHDHRRPADHGPLDGMRGLLRLWRRDMAEQRQILRRKAQRLRRAGVDGELARPGATIGRRLARKLGGAGGEHEHESNADWQQHSMLTTFDSLPHRPPLPSETIASADMGTGGLLIAGP